ncbi:MAG: glycosyltransferase family 39 protein [Polyangiaceae bacterium]|nr:glycosyltransferase family 39 protein [Polyangiaceae bacterium]
MNTPVRTPVKFALVLLPTVLLALLMVSVAQRSYAERLYVHTTYYFLMATVLCWAGTYLHAARDVRRAAIVTWLKENWPGLVIALVVTVIAGLAIHPALRVLSDEANLVGTSKNLFATKTATFTVSGKNYYDSYWDIDVVVDRRPPLFPFLVSLVHVLRGYSYKNVFLFNLMVLPAFVLVSYRLAKSLGGETFAIVASLFVVAHPTALISVRSGGFDFLTAFFALLVIKSLLEHCREPSPATLAILWMNLCMFAEIRYESALFIPPVVALLLLFRMVTWRTLRPYAFIYALTPAYLLPRVSQAMLGGNVPHQDPGTVVFSFKNFLNNSGEYFKPILSPFAPQPAHSALVIALGVVGCIVWLRWLYRRLLAPDWKDPELRFAILVAAWMSVQAVLVFTYAWGRAQYPSAARLVIVIDTFFAFAAAWVLSLALKRWRPFVAVLLAAAVFAIHLPIAAQHRMMNRLTQTRESATTWRFFESLNEKRILIVTDRPNLYTIMGYGAMDFETARNDRFIFKAFARHLFYDIYLVQQVRLSTNELLPAYDIWPDRRLQTMLEFQNDADVLIRISRLAH